MRPPEAAEGIFRLGTRWANFYLLVDGHEATLVDAGYPRYWRQVLGALEALGMPAQAISAVIVTHHHVDHVGTAEQVRREAGATVYVHANDAAIVRGQRRSHVSPGFYRQSWRPSMDRYLAHTVAAGGASYRAVSDLELLPRRSCARCPGPPAGHLHPRSYRGPLLRRGRRARRPACRRRDGELRLRQREDGLHLHRFNEERETALASLGRLDGMDASIVLFGHGDP